VIYLLVSINQDDHTCIQKENNVILKGFKNKNDIVYFKLWIYDIKTFYCVIYAIKFDNNKFNL